MTHEKTFELPDGLLLGTATAATQIEGGDDSNSWYRWAADGGTRDGSTPLTACDHWNRVDEDLALMQRLGVDAYRLGLEWSRIEPEPGRFDETALAHYRDEVEKLVAAGIRPLVTLHHFSNPLWLEDGGGWLRRDVPQLFVRYVERVARALSPLVQDWITINEPNVYLYFGYVEGTWPPGRKGDVRAYLQGARHMIRAHRAAYPVLHAHGEGVRVGVAHHLRVFDPLPHGARGRLVRGPMALLRWLNMDLFLDGMTGAAAAGKRRFADFLGVNYYSRDLFDLTLDPRLLFCSRRVEPDAPVNDLGWEIYPEGLYRVGRDLARRWPDLPILVTENGTCDAADRFRARFIYDHLAQVRRLLDEGVRVEGYYHWTLTDNFEWAEGYTARFGLAHLDFETQARSLRGSGEYFADICRTRTVRPPPDWTRAQSC